MNPVQAVRHFNRFYTNRIGVLSEGLYRSPFSLTEIRVLYELAHRENLTSTELGRELGLDAGYLSRILRRFGEAGLVARTASETDRRQSTLRMTSKGRKVFAPIEAQSAKEVDALLSGLSGGGQARLVSA